MRIVQIYEVTSAAEARALAELGVSHIGVLVGKGKFPREQSFAAACEIFSAVPRAAKRVALSLGESVAEMAEVVENTRPEILHIGTWLEALPPSEVAKLREMCPGTKIMRTIPVRSEKDIAAALAYEGIADFLLLDTWRAGDVCIGATGCVHDWALSRRIVQACRIPVVLAGGIGPENAEQAVRAVNPVGIDSKTRTDNAGGDAKDLEKVRAMVEAVRHADADAAGMPGAAGC